MDLSSRNLYTGASGIVLPVPNKSLYPPEFQERSRLEYYASLFNSLEVNSSFYKLPIAKTVKRWAESVPQHFKFTFKLWKEITHAKGLNFSDEHLEVFFERIGEVGEKKACVLVQFPPSVGVEHIAAFERLLRKIQETNAAYGWRIAVEFRNRSWYRDDISDLLDEYKASMVIQDLPASSPPIPEEILHFAYLRFHGPNGGYRGSYSDDFLSEFASYIQEWEEEKKTVFIYFNNTMGSAVQNLMSLNKYLRQGGG
ncbi:DUF72 domain-containing protein [Pedobacter sp. SYSU D00535]|uniref:DUF72 domain-containing protein n=1 Tax=Pedobacter sp. SYSU D00535 TaxID=2810308 RepID=UPI001A97B947|nr:DUF72 domain-containing protein [Pedobacter sp. SYSU D00535]